MRGCSCCGTAVPGEQTPRFHCQEGLASPVLEERQLFGWIFPPPLQPVASWRNQITESFGLGRPSRSSVNRTPAPMCVLKTSSKALQGKVNVAVLVWRSQV